jgi:hypothetical protein
MVEQWYEQQERSGRKSDGRNDRRMQVIRTLLRVPILRLMRMCMCRMGAVVRIELTLQLEALEAASAPKRLGRIPLSRDHVHVDIAEYVSVLKFVLEFVSVNSRLQGTAIEDRCGNRGGSCRGGIPRARACDRHIARMAALCVWVDSRGVTVIEGDVHGVASGTAS